MNSKTIKERIRKANKRQHSYRSKILKYHKRIQFLRKIRTVYLNGKTISGLQRILNLMLEYNTTTLHIGSEKHPYTLGSTLYLIDIRYNTYYKSSNLFPENKEQWFEPEHLSKIFADREDIKYRYCQSLGNPDKIGKNEEYINDPDKQKELYFQYLQSNHKKYATKDEFDRLFALAYNKKPLYQICLMCYCEPEKRFCHRFWLREALLRRYYEVEEIEYSVPVLPHYPIDHFENKIEKLKVTS